MAPVDAWADGNTIVSVKAPVTLRWRREALEVVDASLPGAGTSYNPAVGAYEALMKSAVDEELELLDREAKEAEKIALLSGVVEARRPIEESEEVVDGMRVDIPLAHEEDAAPESTSTSKKLPGRKTQAQRNKAVRLREAARLAELDKRDRKLLKSMGGISGVRAAVEAQARRSVEGERMSRLAKEAKDRMGLKGGERIGRFKLKEDRVDVQLGEDLAESLRQVKVGLKFCA